MLRSLSRTFRVTWTRFVSHKSAIIFNFFQCDSMLFNFPVVVVAMNLNAPLYSPSKSSPVCAIYSREAAKRQAERRARGEVWNVCRVRQKTRAPSCILFHLPFCTLHFALCTLHFL